MILAERMSRLGTESAFEVLAKAKALEAQGKDIIHLEIGEPDFDTPKNIIKAAQKALDDGFTHYNPAPGLPQLRQTIAEEMNKTRNIDVKLENVVVVPGGKPTMFYAMLALVNEGDEVIYPNPGFPIYESVINFLGAKAVPIPLREEKNFAFDVEEFASLITDKTKMVIINTPQNPTGGVLEKDDMQKIANILKDKDIWVLSDEIYDRIIYDNFEHTSITQFEGMLEKTIILNGYSKTFAMTGWRLGYGIMPEPLAVQIAKLSINCHSCTAAFSQVAGIEALKGPQDEVLAMVEEFRKRRDFFVDGLNSIKGITCIKPKGAFYVFPNITETGMTSKEIEKLLLEEAGIAALAGSAFGKYGEGYLRFSYANSIENIDKALGRISKILER
ncbi:MAG: pyridoxal phosphate-dependent aminotransferase [Pseudomonadota bacterium]